MNIRDKNAEDRELFYARNKFWSENKNEVFKTTIASYYGIEAVTAKKACNHLNKEKAILDKSLKDLQVKYSQSGLLSKRRIKAEISQLTALRDALTASLSRVNDFSEYELVIVNNAESGNGKAHAIESYAEFMHKFTNVYKVVEITQEEHVRNKKEWSEKHNRKERLTTSHDYKARLINAALSFFTLSILVPVIGEDPEMLIRMNSFLLVILATAIPAWMAFAQPWIIKKLIKKPTCFCLHS